MNKLMSLIQRSPLDPAAIRAEKTEKNAGRPLPHDLMCGVFEFLMANDPLAVGKDFLAVGLANHFWKGAVDSIWQEKAMMNRVSVIPQAISHRKYMHDLYAFGSRASWQRAFHIDIGPVPNIPDDLLAKRLERDPWDKTKTVGQTHECVYIPPDITLRGIGLLFAERFPGGSASGYYKGFFEKVLAQHEDDPVVTPGWRLLRKEGVEMESSNLNRSWLDASRSYANQKKAVDKHKNWIIVSLIERVCLNMLMYANYLSYGFDSREHSSVPLIPSKGRYSRTSTLSRNSGCDLPTLVSWKNDLSCPRLSFAVLFTERSILSTFFKDHSRLDEVGVAVGINPKSS